MFRFKLQTLLLTMTVLAVVSAVYTQRQPPLAFEGYCPVSLLENWKWRPGNPDYSVIHRGQRFQFVSQQHKLEFIQYPDRYVPVLGGIDPVLLIESSVSNPGSRCYGIQYLNRIVLFSASETLRRFTNNPAHYMAVIRRLEANN
jgi:YHS domain-containing protein